MAALLALVPAGLLGLLPLLTGGGGLVAWLLTFLPGIQKYATIALVVLLGVAVGYGLLERGNYEGEVAARAGDKAAAEHAALVATQAAQALSDELIIAQAANFAVTEKTVTVYQDRIVHAPTTNACGPTVRDAAAGVRQILNSGGSQAPAVSPTPAAVR